MSLNNHNASPTMLHRRALLGLSAAGVAALAGCKVQTSSSPTNTGVSQAKITLPKPVAKLPTGDVDYRAMMTGGIKKPFFTAVWKAFHTAHTNIKMELETPPGDKMAQAIPLGLRNGTAPDMFQLPSNIPTSLAVKQGWVAALEDVIPDFDEWKKTYPDTAFIPGVHVFNGKTYCWTFTSNKSQYGNLMFFNKKLMDKAGYDPTAERFTTDTLRAALKKITTQGKGKQYGLLVAGTALGGLAMSLATLASMPGSDINYKTGDYNFTHPLLKESIEWLLAVKSDGSFLPGMVSMTGTAEASEQMPQGGGGVTFDGAWCVPNWKESSPDFDYGVATPPFGPDKVDHKVGYVEGTAAPLFAAADSKYHAITGELFRYMGSVEGQIQLGLMTNGLFSSELESVNKKVHSSSLLSGHAKEAVKIMSDLLVTAPMPQVANEDAAIALGEMKPLQPNIGQIVQGVMTGQVKNVSKALTDLQSRAEKTREEAIKAAKKKGAKVSIDDWIYPNWDPEKDYTVKDYSQR